MEKISLQPRDLSEIKRESVHWKPLSLSQRQTCDLEMLLNGAFAPLTGFMKYSDYDSVCSNSRLSDSRPWPMPVTLDVTQEFADSLKYGEKVALRNAQGVMLAALTIEDIWQPNKAEEAESVFSTLN